MDSCSCQNEIQSRYRNRGRGARSTRATNSKRAGGPIKATRLQQPTASVKETGKLENDSQELKRQIALTAKVQRVSPASNKIRSFSWQSQQIIVFSSRATNSAAPNELRDLSSVSKAGTGEDFSNLLNNLSQKFTRTTKILETHSPTKSVVTFQPLPAILY